MSEQEKKLGILLKILKKVYAEEIPFHQLLQLQMLSFEKNNVCIRVDAREELFGNYKYKMMHGGVISSILDTTGSVITSIAVMEKIKDRPFEEIKERMFKVSTVNLNIGFIAPGRRVIIKSCV